ncbi:MAG TPA: SAP domain-containing protein [Gammaproteobacteria bacterium]|nr:SAP domain-containing protein [Gammaproteobacteria bacterium]
MNMQEIRGIATDHGLKPGRAAKAELVRRIQREEGNFDCFGTAYAGVCDQAGCLWREDCFRASMQGRGHHS